jgi:hypothetical protein
VSPKSSLSRSTLEITRSSENKRPRSGRVAKNARKWQSPGVAGEQSYLTSNVRSNPSAVPPASDSSGRWQFAAGCASDFSAARQRMVQEQLSASGRDIKNRLVLDAMATVPRHEFVPETLRKFAYWDEPLPIGYGQTISQPFIVAFMTEQLNPKPTDRILEIGTGFRVPGRYSFAACS